ncbi:hypothetical protein [Peredibacter starrii]|uniref:Uncharacterized protein n=1 Tax=Peredibacter starrii TaxID=28202 RepID=A0AAX4HM70_9BACT|nr:hypothetical protein [Peredibacter starrii]WPU64316.1 hypothetical protein SOO65_16600 [Peredibacter starrii]
MSKNPLIPKYQTKFNLSRHAIIPAVFVFVIFGSIIWLNSMQKCRATDFTETSRHDKYYTAFTTDAACSKALAVCSYYSKDPKKCKIVE